MKKISLILISVLVLCLSMAIMAQAAVTVTHVRTIGTIDSFEMIKDVTIALDNSYTGSGGEALTAATLGFVTAYSGFCDPSGGYVFQYDKTNAKLKMFWVDTTTDGAVMAEVTAATDVSAQTAVSCRFTGK